jgi:ABC-2 type transport system permease protein
VRFDLALFENWLSYFVVADIKIKYKSSALGMVWSMFAPALTLGIYYVVLPSHFEEWNSRISRSSSSPDCSCGTFSQTSSPRQQASWSAAQPLLKKVSFPREILALSTVGTSSIYLGLPETP